MNWKIKIPGNFSYKKLLYNKRFTIPFSLIMAFIIWLIIMINQNPERDRTFSDVTVNINLDNTFVKENDMQIIGDITAQKFSVVIRGPSYVVSSLKTNDFYIYASAAAVNAPGEYHLEVAGAKNSAINDYEVVSVSPATVDVTFDYVDTKEFTIKANAEGASATDGLIAETAVVSGTESDTITIKGPRTVINNINSVIAYAKVNKVLSKSEAFDAEIKLYDEEDNEIDSSKLTLGASKVKVTVPISKKITVPVVADFTNLPSGFNKQSISYTVNHSAVAVIGIPEAIEKIKQVTLSAIDITAISTGSNNFDVSAKLPEGVRLLDTIDQFKVSINTTGYAERTFNVSSVNFTGLSTSYKASSPDIIKNVKICGPRAVINRLRDSDLYAVVNLSDKKPGEHTVLATIKSDKYNNIWQIGTYNSTVKIY